MENEIFTQFVLLSGYTYFGKNILHRQSTSLGHSATGHPAEFSMNSQKDNKIAQ